MAELVRPVDEGVDGGLGVELEGRLQRALRPSPGDQPVVDEGYGRSGHRRCNGLRNGRMGTFLRRAALKIGPSTGDPDRPRPFPGSFYGSPPSGASLAPGALSWRLPPAEPPRPAGQSGDPGERG